jgi:hypothetical protein
VEPTSQIDYKPGMAQDPTSSESSGADSWARADIDLGASRLLIHTSATGLLARFAHDLEIEATKPDLDARVEGKRWKATLRAPVAGMRVVGVRKGEKVREDVLSHSDQDEIHRRLREQVLVAMDTVRVEAHGDAPEQGEATVILARGRQTVRLSSRVETNHGAGTTISGRCKLSLSKLGVPEVKGPLGAFRVFDEVEILYSFAVRPIG